MALSKINLQSSEAIASLNEERPLLSRRAHPVRLPDIQRSFLSVFSVHYGSTAKLEKQNRNPASAIAILGGAATK